MDRLEEAFIRVPKTIFAKFRPRWLSESFNEYKDLPDDKNNTSPRGKESGFVSRKFDVLIEKLFMP